MEKSIIKQRNSSFELLRLICIYGIISMHSFGGYLQSATGFERVYACIINSIFNMGVSLFMLISGYFGIDFSIKKLVKLLVTVIVYSLANTSFALLVNHYFSVKDLLKAVFAIFTNRYWYATAYVILFCLAPFINDFLSKMDKKKYNVFIIILFVFFVAAPTLLQEQILNDGGKGFVNMFLLYIVGRYIKIFGISLSKAKSFVFSFFIITILCLLTISTSVNVYSDGGGYTSDIVMIILALSSLLLYLPFYFLGIFTLRVKL